MLDRFLEYLATVKRFSPLTLRNYRRDVEGFIAWWEEPEAGGVQEKAGLPAPGHRTFSPKRVTTDDIRAWIVHRTETGQLSAASMNREISSLRSFFRYLQRTGEIETEPFRAIRALKTSRRLPAFVPTTRMEGILDGMRQPNSDAAGRHDHPAAQGGTTFSPPGHSEFKAARDALIILLFYSCGLRLAELVGIDRTDFSADFSTLKVRGKGDKERLVPILAAVQQKLKRYLHTLERQNICISQEKALFLTEQGRRISRSTVYRLVKTCLQQGGVQGKTNPHVLRHTFATELLNNGADMREIQELLGHASLQATQVYTHNSIARLQEVYAKAHPHAKRGSDKE